MKQPLDDKIKAVEEGRWDELIESHMRLANKIANSYDGDRDEMVSAAYVGLCVAVDRIKEKGLRHNNVTAYIGRYIHQHVQETRRKDCVIPHPRGEQIRQAHSLLDTGKSAFSDFEINDILEQITQTPVEEKIIMLRRHGYTDAQISVKLDTPQSSVTRTRHRLLNRFNTEVRK